MSSYPHVFLHRGPSRFLWFIFGAGVATWCHSVSTRDHRCLMHRRIQDTAGNPPPASGPDRFSAGEERFGHLQKRAGDTAVDLSESTLDSIISGAESLKAKLVQLRVEREQLEAEKKATQQAV